MTEHINEDLKMSINEYDILLKKVESICNGQSKIHDKIDNIDNKLDEFKEKVYTQQLSCARSNVSKSLLFSLLGIICTIIILSTGIYAYKNSDIIERLTTNEIKLENHIESHDVTIKDIKPEIKARDIKEK